MKIAYLFDNASIGGAEIYALNLAKAAINAGHNVVFVLSKEGELSERIKSENIKYELIPMQSSFNLAKMLSSVLNLRKYFVENNIEIVHAQMLREQSLSIGAKFLGAKIKVVRTFHRLDQFNWKMRPLIWFYRWQTDRTIAISDFMKEYLVKNGFKSKVSLIYNGVDPVSAEKHEKNLGFLGRLAKEKGIAEFVKENVRLFEKDNLIIAGTGPDEAKIMAQKVKGVRMLGQIADLKGFFSKISVLMLPSATEVLPLAVLEAFSAGVPVVSFDLPSLTGIVTVENGVLVRGDYTDLAKAAINLLHDSNQLNKKSNRARIDYKEKFSLTDMWQKTEEVYKGILK